MKQRPFAEDADVSSGSLELLRDWLELLPNSQQITSEYTVGNLVADLDKILDGMWNDGIDAMGEDA